MRGLAALVLLHSALLAVVGLAGGEEKRTGAARVSGVVRWDDGTPAVQASVELSGCPRDGRLTTELGRSDGSGRYSFETNCLGVVILTAARSRSEGLQVGSGTELTLRLGPGDVRLVDLQVRRGSHRISGSVQNDRGPQSHAEVAVILLRTETPTLEAVVRTNAEGEFVARELPVGEYRISASSRGFIPGMLEHVSVDGPPVHLRLAKGASIHGIVRQDPRADSVAVTVQSKDGTSERILTKRSFVFEGLSLGEYRISARSGMRSASQVVIVEAIRDYVVSLTLANLKSPVDLVGRIVDETTGSGVPGALVVAVHDDGQSLARAESTNDGSFTLRGVPVQRPVSVRVDAMGYQRTLRSIDPETTADSFDLGGIPVRKQQ